MQHLSLLNLNVRDPNATERLHSPSFWTNLKDLLTERSIKVTRSEHQEAFRKDGLDTSFTESFKAFFRSTPRTKGTPVPPLSTKRREYKVAQTISAAAHVLMILMVVVPIARHIGPPPTQTATIVNGRWWSRIPDLPLLPGATVFRRRTQGEVPRHGRLASDC
jgi:hypothetical protein